MLLLTGKSRRSPVASSARRRLDMAVVLMTILVWMANFGLLFARPNAVDVVLTATIRFVMAAIGILFTLGLHVFFRNRTLSSGSKFGLAVLLSVPFSVVIALINEMLWLSWSTYYRNRYGLSTGNILNYPQPLLTEAMPSAVGYFWILLSWSALYTSTHYAIQLRDRDRLLAKAEAEAHKAQLEALRNQLNPHFLFNTMNTLSGMIALDRKSAAEQTLLGLSSILRHSLTGAPTEPTTLNKEIDVQATYLGIEKARFADRLSFRIDVPADCGSVLVPPFLLQPLVENAIKHAVAPSKARVEVLIRARRTSDGLVITVENGPPEIDPSAAQEGFGIGMANVTRRLAALYGASASLTCQRTSEGGWINRIELPWAEETNANSAG